MAGQGLLVETGPWVTENPIHALHPKVQAPGVCAPAELHFEAFGARWGADRSVDAIRKKFGRASVGYAAVVFSDGHRVPEEFRELAEHSTSD
jgi:hypothetical protein